MGRFARDGDRAGSREVRVRGVLEAQRADPGAARQLPQLTVATGNLVSRAVFDRAQVRWPDRWDADRDRGRSRLPRGKAAELAKKQAAILKCQVEVDGSFVDAQAQGKSYSTAMAVLTLVEDLRLESR